MNMRNWSIQFERYKEKKDKLMTESIDISSLAKGVYMIEVSTEQVKTVRRLVKE